jgi:HK97 family phage portal protein
MFISRHIGAGPSPADDFWYMPVGGRTMAGVRVTPEQAMRLSTVYKCVRVRAETLGMLPLITYRRLDNGGKERAPRHPLSDLLRSNPNPWQTAMQFREMAQSHLDLRGNSYTHIAYNGAGRPDMLVPLHPDFMRVEVLPNGNPRFRYNAPNKGERIFVQGEILHVAGLSADGYTGLSPIELERESIGAAIASRDYGARYFENDARPPGWVEFSGKFENDEAKRKWRGSWKEAYGGPNRGTVAVLEHGMKYHELGVKNTDAQWLESRKYQDIDICGIYRMPPHKVGILDQSKWANIEQQALDFVQDAILPSCVRWEQTLMRDLEFGEGYFAEFLIDMLLRSDTKTRYEAYGKAIQDGWMVRNEARERENLNPIDGLDAPLQPLNMAPAGSKASSRERGDPQEPSQRYQALLHAAAQRVVNKEVAAISKEYERAVGQAGAGGAVDAFARAVGEFYQAHAVYVADLMACDDAVAQAYVEGAKADLMGAVSAEQATGQRVVQPLIESWQRTRAAALARAAG